MTDGMETSPSLRRRRDRVLMALLSMADTEVRLDRSARSSYRVTVGEHVHDQMR
ncbi:hypothetical protein [Mycolicibacterium diernhoferi]|uniref:hypothetical protein n=1 Tax=Mycolicibacterium diernhoferi TaxID=1801 RepID=UPI00197B23D1|nr:hypothetical protein [Mycolicibacterium diernhoferi]QYL20563.1 hypothetical protein K0O62_15840 [Mycolicibacterium diernhoferi]